MGLWGDEGGRKGETLELKKDHRLDIMPSNCLEKPPSKETSRQSSFEFSIPGKGELALSQGGMCGPCPEERGLCSAAAQTVGRCLPRRPRGNGGRKGPATPSSILCNL